MSDSPLYLPSSTNLHSDNRMQRERERRGKTEVSGLYWKWIKNYEMERVCVCSGCVCSRHSGQGVCVQDCLYREANAFWAKWTVREYKRMKSAWRQLGVEYVIACDIQTSACLRGQLAYVGIRILEIYYLQGLGQNRKTCCRIRNHCKHIPLIN